MANTGRDRLTDCVTGAEEESCPQSYLYSGSDFQNSAGLKVIIKSDDTTILDLHYSMSHAVQSSVFT